MSTIQQNKSDIMKLRKGINFLAADLLTEPIEVFQPVLVSDGEGGFSVTLNKTADIWGMLVPEGNDRTLIAAEVSYTQQARVFVRYPLTIDNTYKLGINAQQWTIHSINDLDNRKEYLEIKIYR